MIKAIEYAKEGVELSFTEVITSKEIYDANTEIIEHLKSSPYKYQLWLFQKVDDFKISAQELENTALRNIEASKTHPGIKVAIVSDSPLVFGIGRMYEAYYKVNANERYWETMIFYDVKKAREWISS